MDCYLLSHGISIEKKDIQDCCLMHNFSKPPHIIRLDKNHKVDWEKFFELKREQKKEKIKSSRKCKGCRLLDENADYSNDEDYIANINLNHWNMCNSKCVYCCDYYNGGDKYFNVLPLIQDLFNYKDGKCIKFLGELTFQGGEPTVLPEFEELINLFTEKQMKIRIHSSGIKYSKAVEKGLENNNLSIVISPDSGIKKTYEKIKRVKCFDEVWENIKNYAKAQKENDKVKVKFIIIPGINNSVKEIDSFIKKVKEAEIKHVIWEVEGYHSKKYKYKMPDVVMLLDYAVSESIKNGLAYEFYDNAMYTLEKRKNKQEDIKNKSDFIKRYNIIKQKYKIRDLNYPIFED